MERFASLNFVKRDVKLVTGKSITRVIGNASREFCIDGRVMFGTSGWMDRASRGQVRTRENLVSSWLCFL